MKRPLRLVFYFVAVTLLGNLAPAHEHSEANLPLGRMPLVTAKSSDQPPAQLALEATVGCDRHPPSVVRSHNQIESKSASPWSVSRSRSSVCDIKYSRFVYEFVYPPLNPRDFDWIW